MRIKSRILPHLFFLLVLLLAALPAQAQTALWEIQTRERSAIFLGCFIIGACCILWCAAIPGIDLFALMGNPSSPASAYPLNTYKSSFIRNWFFPIRRILRSVAFAKILSAVIERVSVFVVAQLPSLTSQNEAVHGHTVTVTAPSIKTLRMRIPLGSPIPSIEPFQVSGIHDGVLSLRKWNQSVGLVERLDNRVAFHAVFHRPSLKGLLKFSRHFSIFVASFLFLPAARSQTSISINIHWSDSVKCTCSVSLLQKGINGAPDTMPFVGTTDSTGHIAAKVALDPMRAYTLTISSLYYNITVWQMTFIPQFLTPVPLRSVGPLNLIFTRPQVNGVDAAPPLTVQQCPSPSGGPCYVPPVLVGV